MEEYKLYHSNQLEFVIDWRVYVEPCVLIDYNAARGFVNIGRALELKLYVGSLP